MDADQEFMAVAELADLGPELIETANENFEDISFDAFNFCVIFAQMPGGDKSLAYLLHKIWGKYDLYRKYHISTECLHNFACEVSYNIFNMHRWPLVISKRTNTTVKNT